MESIYREIAKKYGVSESEVRGDMQKAIADAYEGVMPDGEEAEILRSRIPCQGELPTPEEFIKYMAEELSKKQNF